MSHQSEQRGIEELVESFLYGPSDHARQLLDSLSSEPDDPIAFVKACLRRNRTGRKPGLVLDDHFELPHLRKQYPEEILNFLVPEHYTPDKSVGLMVLLHGGGSGTPRDKARQWLLDPEGEAGAYHFGRELRKCPFISVAPSNLLLPTHKRWSNPESDAYLLAVIEEAAYRYNIDPDRVYLLGQSMGGFGAFHTVQTLGDRFATTGCHAGAWYYAFWEGLRNVDFYIMQGIHDAEPGVRPRFTDLPFARMASAILSGFHIPHTYREHAGGHSFTDPEARRACIEFFEYVKDRKRNPFPDRVVTASRKGAFDLYDAPHHYWISIDEVHFGTFELDHMEPTESTPSYCTTDFRHRTIRARGGTVDATNEGNNRFTIRTHNVDRFILWLNPSMADLARPIQVVVNGDLRHDAPVSPSLRTTLESFDRKRDEGQLCCAKIEFNIKVNDWERQKTLFVNRP